MAVVLVLVFAGSAYGIQRWSEATYRDLEFVGFDVERVAAVEAKLTSWPTRHSGTQYEGMAAEYIASQFRSAGLRNVVVEAYDEVLYEVLGASLQLVHYVNGPLGLVPDPREEPVSFTHEVDFVVQGYSGSLAQAPPGPTAFRSDLEYVHVDGNGTETSQYAGAAGRVAIVETEPVIRNTPVMQAASDAGAAAVILHNVNIHENIGYVPISKGARQPDGWPDPSYPDIPIIMVSKECGDRILGAPSAKLRMHVDVDIGIRKVHVVTGEVRGTKNPDEFVLIGAHHDSVYVCPGAVDNGSGTTTVIELAHQLSRMEPERSIRFATFGAEEDGLLGSFAYAEEHADELKRCRAMLNFDMPHINLQRGNQGWVTPDDRARFGLVEAILDDVYAADPRLREMFNISVEWAEHPGEIGSDSAPFAELGIETCNFWGSGAWEYHTYIDEYSHFTPQGLEMAVLIGGSYAMWLADH